MKFDLVIGNPPYNDPRGIKGGGKNLYSPFIKKSLELLERNGFLVYVTNAGWLKKTNPIDNDILRSVMEKNLLFLNINECKKWFDVGGSMIFSHFIVQNNNNYEKTEVVSQIGKGFPVYKSKLNLKDRKWIPRIINEDIIELIKKFEINKFNFKRIDNIELYNIENRDYIGFKRLNHLVPPFRVNATENMKKGTFIITKSNNKKSDLNFLNSKIFSFLNLVHRYDPVIYHKFITKFGYRGDVSNIKNDNEMYQYFKLQQPQIDLIEETIK